MFKQVFRKHSYIPPRSRHFKFDFTKIVVAEGDYGKEAMWKVCKQILNTFSDSSYKADRRMAGQMHRPKSTIPHELIRWGII